MCLLKLLALLILALVIGIGLGAAALYYLSGNTALTGSASAPPPLPALRLRLPASQAGVSPEHGIPWQIIHQEGNPHAPAYRQAFGHALDQARNVMGRPLPLRPNQPAVLALDPDLPRSRPAEFVGPAHGSPDIIARAASRARYIRAAATPAPGARLNAVLIHEVAHYWWSLPPAPDYGLWLNEWGAETVRVLAGAPGAHDHVSSTGPCHWNPETNPGLDAAAGVCLRHQGVLAAFALQDLYREAHPERGSEYLLLALRALYDLQKDRNDRGNPEQVGRHFAAYLNEPQHQDAAREIFRSVR